MSSRMLRVGEAGGRNQWNYSFFIDRLSAMQSESSAVVCDECVGRCPSPGQRVSAKVRARTAIVRPRLSVRRRVVEGVGAPSTHGL
jgi:hypothetical protein